MKAEVVGDDPIQRLQESTAKTKVEQAPSLEKLVAGNVPRSAMLHLAGGFIPPRLSTAQLPAAAAAASCSTRCGLYASLLSAFHSNFNFQPGEYSYNRCLEGSSSDASPLTQTESCCKRQLYSLSSENKTHTHRTYLSFKSILSRSRILVSVVLK